MGSSMSFDYRHAETKVTEDIGNGHVHSSVEPSLAMDCSYPHSFGIPHSASLLSIMSSLGLSTGSRDSPRHAAPTDPPLFVPSSPPLKNVQHSSPVAHRSANILPSSYDDRLGNHSNHKEESARAEQPKSRNDKGDSPETFPSGSAHSKNSSNPNAQLSQEANCSLAETESKRGEAARDFPPGVVVVQSSGMMRVKGTDQSGPSSEENPPEQGSNLKQSQEELEMDEESVDSDDSSQSSALTSDASTNMREIFPSLHRHPIQYHRRTVNDATHVSVAAKGGVFLAPLAHHTSGDKRDSGAMSATTYSTATESGKESNDSTKKLASIIEGIAAPGESQGGDRVEFNSTAPRQMSRPPMTSPLRPLAPPPPLWVPVMLPDPMPQYRIAGGVASLSDTFSSSDRTGLTRSSSSLSPQLINGRPDPQFFFAVTRENVASLTPAMWRQSLQAIGAPLSGLGTPLMALQYLQRYFDAVKHDPCHAIYIERGGDKSSA
jgi:hypothetical protein